MLPRIWPDFKKFGSAKKFVEIQKNRQYASRAFLEARHLAGEGANTVVTTTLPRPAF
jgi:hypothetical protein